MVAVENFAKQLEEQMAEQNKRLNSYGLDSMSKLFPQLDDHTIVDIADLYKKAAQKQNDDPSFNEARLYSMKQMQELVLCFLSQSQTV